METQEQSRCLQESVSAVIVTRILCLMAVEKAVWEEKSLVSTGIAFQHDVWLVPQGQRGNMHHCSYPKLNRHRKFCYFLKGKCRLSTPVQQNKRITLLHFSHLHKWKIERAIK